MKFVASALAALFAAASADGAVTPVCSMDCMKGCYQEAVAGNGGASDLRTCTQTWCGCSDFVADKVHEFVHDVEAQVEAAVQRKAAAWVENHHDAVEAFKHW